MAKFPQKKLFKFATKMFLLSAEMIYGGKCSGQVINRTAMRQYQGPS